MFDNENKNTHSRVIRMELVSYQTNDKMQNIDLGAVRSQGGGGFVRCREGGGGTWYGDVRTIWFKKTGYFKT